MRWAEMDRYLPHERPAPSPQAYRWLFHAIGVLHRTLRAYELHVPRPYWTTYGPPTTLLRWLPTLQTAVQGDQESEAMAHRVHRLVAQFRRQWIPATHLPRHLIHGDMRLGNICRDPHGTTLYLDFGFLAHRPRVYELGYSLAWMLLALDGCEDPASFRWELVAELLQIYEEAAGVDLTPLEHEALGPCIVSVPLYQAAICGFMRDPVADLRSDMRHSFLHLAEWVLAHPQPWR